MSPAPSGYQSSIDKTPSPVAPNMSAGHPAVSPPSSHMSVAAMVSPPASNGTDSRRLEHQPSMDSSHSTSTLGGPDPSLLSRRESVDSRINQGFSDMRLGGNSPYATHNHSTTSIQNTLNSQRHPRAGLDSSAVQRISNGYAPSADRNPSESRGTTRTAPAITGPATGNIARAAEPTKGQAWAFPEDERISQPPQPPHPYDLSRRSSISESIASSQFTADSRLPPGQKRLDDGPSPPLDDYPMHMPHHPKLADLQAGEFGLGGNQPYSRTPELRVSHKLAERKRRTEMKELFDALRDEMPQERGSKASKWEILTKAINEHRQQKEYIALLQTKYQAIAHENDALRRELHAYRGGEGSYRSDAPSQAPPPPPQQQAPPPPPPSAPAPAPPHSSSQHGYPPAAPDHYGPPSSSSRNELPPLRSLGGNMHAGGGDSMTGVQYDTPGSSGPGYRQERY